MSVDNVPIATLARLRELMFASAGGAGVSPFDAHPYLVVQPTGDHGAATEDIAAWLCTQPVPVIGIGGANGDPKVLAACDLVLERLADLNAIAANIRRAPLAAMSLVQVLRTTADMRPAPALNVESLAYSTLQAGPEFAAWSRANPPTPHEIPVEDGPPVRVIRRGKRLEIMLNRPRSRNSMTIAVRDALVEALQLVAIDDTIGEAKVVGAGACFSTGGELREFGTALDPASAHAVRSLRLPAGALLRCATRVAFHVHGACIGAGIELPAFATRLTATRSAFFQLPEIRFGLIPGAGGCVSLPLRIGRQRTAYLALSARRISAAVALEWGLIDEIID